MRLLVTIGSLLRASALATALVPTICIATDGYFASGFGLKSSGMGGVSAALAEEPFGGANNPGAMAFLDDRWQLSGAWFSPMRTGSRRGSGPLGIDGSAQSGSEDFFIPEFGLNWKLRPDLAVGVSIYGNGLNTDYPGNEISAPSACATFNPETGPYNLLCGSGRLGVDALQVLISPFVSWELTANHAVGFAPIIAYQQVATHGLQSLDNPLLSTRAGSVSDRGYQKRWGAGVRIGYMGYITNAVSVGLSWSSKVSMGNYDHYAGLLAQSGNLDIPETLLAGIAVRLAPDLLVALDYKRIRYSEVQPLGNTSAILANCVLGQRDACLGGASGAAFGWQDIDVWKVGIQYSFATDWTVRAGYSRNDAPIPAQEVTLNILAPAVTEQHYSAGITYKLDGASEISGAFAYAPKSSVTGPSLFIAFGAPSTTLETITMKQILVGVGYTRRF